VKILIVEDQRQLGQFLKKNLVERGHIATWAPTCAEARAAVQAGPFDAILLDLSLPDGDGLSLLQLWRKSGFNGPVLILSARDAVADRVSGLDLGADDYLPKPFSFEEVMARLRSLLRRQASAPETVLQHRNIRMELLARTVTLDGHRLELTAREFALLEMFLHNPGRILTRTLIAEKVWDSSYDVDANLLDVYMSKLRSKLTSPADKPLFRTVRGVGYQLM
jgi:two-component system copper resistance phosphate regulon response regulator CusR/two-component system response regulator QseB